MIKSFRDIGKFILTFSLFLLVTIPLYMKFVPSKSQEILSSFSNNKLETICPLSPKDQTFQECFKKYLATALDDSRPLDFYSILDKIQEIHSKDLLHSDTDAQKEFANLLYFENIGLLLDHYQVFKISRSNFTFLDIFTLPFASKLFSAKLSPIILEFNDFKPMRVPEHRYKIIKKKLEHYQEILN